MKKKFTMVFTNEYIRDPSKDQFQFFHVDLNHFVPKKEASCTILPCTYKLEVLHLCSIFNRSIYKTPCIILM